MRTRAQSRKLERVMTLSILPNRMSLDQQDAEQQLLHRLYLINYDVTEHHDMGVEPAVPASVVA